MGSKVLIGVEELKESGNTLWRGVLGELLGTFLLVFIGCGSCIALNPLSPPSVVQIALTFGFVLATLVQSLGHVSGCHVNPAVSLGLLVAGKTSVLKAIVFIAAQCVGAIGGAAALKGVTPSNNVGSLGATTVSPLLEAWQGLVVEAIITWVLVTVVQAATDENRPELGGNAAPVAVGLAIATCHLFAIPYTGSAMNPARALGPAVVQHIWDAHWVYWVGSAIGAILSGAMYRFVFKAPAEDQTSYNM